MSNAAVLDAELQRLAMCRCEKIELAGLFARNPTAHKWKAFNRTIVLRELIYWRFHDLLVQVQLLASQKHALGARILLRSALETVAMLVFINFKMQQVLDGKVGFQEFGDSTSKLLLGSRDESTSLEAINILTVLKKCGSKHPGLVQLHELLCEAAHPNFDGLLGGYGETDHKNHVTHFVNSWKERWGVDQYQAVVQCISTFEHEYNDVWPPLYESLERWVEHNDADFEAQQNGI